MTRYRKDGGADAHLSGSIGDAFDERVGPKLLEAMQNLVPFRSGALYRALTFEVDRSNPDDVILRAGVDAGTDEEVTYGLFVEQGTSRMAAQPFMRPALGQVGARIK